MVLIVGTVLAFIYMALKPTQDKNIANDKRNQILSAVHLNPSEKSMIEDSFNKFIVDGFLVDSAGNKMAGSDKQAAFDVNMKNNVKETPRPSGDMLLSTTMAPTSMGHISLTRERRLDWEPKSARPTSKTSSRTRKSTLTASSSQSA